MAADISDFTLGEINAAIRAILKTGIAYSRPGLSLTRSALGDLRALRKDKMSEDLRSGSNTGISFVDDFGSSRRDGSNDFDC